MDDTLIYVRAVHYVAAITVAGVVFFLVFIAEPAFATPATMRACPPRCGRRSHGWRGSAFC